ncbi:5'-adenylylsulfate reductase-like 5 [Lactuca sativa]|uniref:Thioredoxin domain-containing protein n=1 Tax=Lactuca sativa TaxID=4236 RepID=A0A9R1WPB1_LACSA|nr:5'-adenylylsulfate reductase-like 5 [Lactuca sativa]KAJ0227268.1 hypothetical protein LSAT_V11C100027380 [Lactuca sativa]
MGSSMRFSLLLMLIMMPLSSFASSSQTCPQIKPFLHDLQLQCPTTIMYSSPIKMNGDSLDKVLSSSHMNAHVAILFYASSCPFSTNFLPKFDALTSMFPQIKHVTIEQSSVPPIVFSRFGIHGVPSILIINKTTRIRHHGSKELLSLVHFYEKATGLEPLIDLTQDEIGFPESKSKVLESCTKSEPYLLFSLFFIFLKTLLYLYPNMVSNFIALWFTYIPHLNLAIFGESRQILARVLHLVDLKRAFLSFGKLKLIKSVVLVGQDFFLGRKAVGFCHKHV